MEPNTPLCQVTCSDGTVYTLVSCVRGRLIEVNMQLLSDPSLLTTPAKVSIHTSNPYVDDDSTKTSAVVLCERERAEQKEMYIWHITVYVCKREALCVCVCE